MTIAQLGAGRGGEIALRRTDSNGCAREDGDQGGGEGLWILRQSGFGGLQRSWSHTSMRRFGGTKRQDPRNRCNCVASILPQRVKTHTRPLQPPRSHSQDAPAAPMAACSLAFAQ